MQNDDDFVEVTLLYIIITVKMKLEKVGWTV
jgi:hypothetical protein